jgi:tetratricopeptide (TPR) repeat protein
MSAQRAAGASAEQSEVGRKLGARWVVAGSYQRAGNRLRITPRVFEAASGELISTGKVDGSYDEVFELQDRVVQEVVSALRLHIDSSTMQRIVTPDTRHLQAYEEYAQGRVLFHQLGKTSLEDARKHFERALEVDADYAMAHSALGATYAMRYIHRTDADDLTRAVGHLERARELDPELAEPYPYLCYAYSRQGKLNAAIEAGERGVALQPDHVQAVYFLAVAYLLTSQQRLDMLQPAVSTLVRATAVDPGWTPSWFILVDMAIRDGQYERAEDFLKRFRELSAAGRMVNQFLGWEIFDAILLARRGCFQEALTVHQRAHELMAARDHMYRETLMAANACCAGELRLRDNDGANALHDFRRARQLVQEYPRMLGADRVRARAASGFAAAYYQLGDSAHGEEQLRAARESMSEVERMPQTLVFTCDTGTLQYSLATAECLAGAREEALAALGHTTEAGFGDAQWLASDPVFSDVRSTERFAALLATLQSRPKLDFTISNSSAMAPRASVVAQ